SVHVLLREGRGCQHVSPRAARMVRAPARASVHPDLAGPALRDAPDGAVGLDGRSEGAARIARVRSLPPAARLPDRSRRDPALRAGRARDARSVVQPPDGSDRASPRPVSRLADDVLALRSDPDLRASTAAAMELADAIDDPLGAVGGPSASP